MDTLAPAGRRQISQCFHSRGQAGWLLRKPVVVQRAATDITRAMTWRITTFFPVYGKLGAFHHGRSHPEPEGTARLSLPTARGATQLEQSGQKPCDSWKSDTSRPTEHEARAGMSLPNPALPDSTSFSPSVITQRARSARYGQVNRCQPIGVSPIPQRLPEQKMKFVVRFGTCFFYSTGASACS